MSKGTDVSTVATIGVCGAGAMGGGIAQVAATAGHHVVVFDTAAAALEAGTARLAGSLQSLVQRGRMSADEAERVAHRVEWVADLEPLARCGLVVEAILEDADIKQALFKKLEEIVALDAILATNTSSLSIARLGRNLADPSRFLGMHFFNPPTAMKLVEVIRGPATTNEVEQAVIELAAAWKKVPVPVADVPGFIVNRVARPFYAEAFRALQERAAAPEAIDHLFRASAGFRMGPLELTDLIGQDVNFTVARSVFDSYFGMTRFAPQRAQAELVDAGWLGRKTGRGVYDYSAGAPAPWSPGASPVSAARGLEQDSATRLSADTMLQVEGVDVVPTRGRTAAREASEAGRPVAVLDWFDDETATSVAFAVSAPHAAEMVERLIAESGRQPVKLEDRPGLILARTLAQIANAAGDAVLDGVADEAGIDNALINGANYPSGPCRWARGLGATALCDLLSNIAEETGQPIYNPSEHWRKAARS